MVVSARTYADFTTQATFEIKVRCKFSLELSGLWQFDSWLFPLL